MLRTFPHTADVTSSPALLRGYIIHQYGDAIALGELEREDEVTALQLIQRLASLEHCRPSEILAEIREEYR